jgi:TrmH family RNA methyltransferase
MCSAAGIPVTVSDKTLSRISRRTDCWAAGVFAKWSDELDAAADHVVLVQPRDMGNLGTIMRTMLAHDVRDLEIVGNACDVFDPRVVRSSMGALFQMRVAVIDSFTTYSSQFGRKSYCLMSDAATPLPAVSFSRPFSLVFGPEGEGLPPEYTSLGTPVRIPQSEAVDSLNLAVAVGIALYAATQSAV